MYVKDLIEKLKNIDPEYQIFIANDAEGNEIKTIDGVLMGIFDKTNNNGTYDAYVIYPTDTVIN